MDLREWVKWLFGARGDESEDSASAETPEPLDDARPQVWPAVFECRLCGKVFESRQHYPMCPECDSPDVEREA